MLTVKILLCLTSAGPHATDQASAADAGGPRDPALVSFLAEFDRAQMQASTMVARFTETKHLSLLAKPAVSSGRFYFSRPNRVRWEYESPERRIFVLTEDRYVAFYPEARRADDVDIKRFVGKRLFRFLGVGQASGDLAKYYDMRLAEDAGQPGTRLLVLTPRRKRIGEHVAAMKIWVDAKTFVPRQVAYEEPDGDAIVIAFDEPKVNVEVAERTFKVEFPAGVQISQAFSGLALGF